jgi:hypothetical protein
MSALAIVGDAVEQAYQRFLRRQDQSCGTAIIQPTDNMSGFSEISGGVS